jgi:hypothetical protein
MIHVAVDLFSGRPNPGWDLTALEGEEFLRCLRGLNKVHGSISVPDGLGYRGLTVSASDEPVGGFDEVIVSGGVALCRRADGEEAFADSDLVLERWLVRTGQGRLDSALYAVVTNALGGV